MELAIGWQSGLQRLLGAGFSGDAALRLAMYTDDLSSSKIILAADNFPRENGTWTDVLGDLFMTPRDIQQAVIETFSHSAASVGDHSVYHALFDFGRPPCLTILQSFYANGFESVDSLNEEGQTPLFWACLNSIGRSWTRETLQSIQWLLDKGACPNFFSVDSYPNLLFYIANSYPRQLADDIRFPSKEFESLVKRSASVCDPLCSDGCRCYCSTAGCLSCYEFWSSDAFRIHHSSVRIDALHKWLSLCTVDETQSKECYEDILRLEVFDRLGMAHTCCRRQGLYMDETDQEDLWEEDAVLREQMELIIEGYLKCYERYAGGLKRFWKSCFQDLDVLLPRSRDNASQSDDADELDFIDIIRGHFAGSVDSESLWNLN